MKTKYSITNMSEGQDISPILYMKSWQYEKMLAGITIEGTP
jgi:hypothetical protein